jgi:nucleotide-binding universal stress UspA family protein
MINTVAVGTDGSETAAKAVDSAIELADRFDAKLVLVSAYRGKSDSAVNRESRDAPDDVQWRHGPREDVEATLEDAGKRAGERGVEWTSDAEEGDAAEALVSLADRHGADVLVVGNKGMNRKLLGSVPNDVAHTANCDVLIVNTT